MLTNITERKSVLSIQNEENRDSQLRGTIYLFTRVANQVSVGLPYNKYKKY